MSMCFCSSRLSGSRGGAPNSASKRAFVVEIVEIEAERAVVLDVDQLVADHVHVFRRAIGREPHQLVLARIDLEAGIVGEGRIEQAERVREMDLFVDRELVAFAERDRRRGPLADAVEREHQRALVRRRIEGGRRMAQMVLAERQAIVPVELRRHLLEFVRKQ
jgi:hypothetical protein